MLRKLMVATCRVGLLVLGVAVLSPSSLGQTTLRWKFEPGQKFNQVMEQDMKMSMKISDRPIDTTVNQTIDGVWEVKSVDDQGVAEVVQQFHRIRMKMSGMGGLGFEIDTDSDEQPTGVGATLAPALQAMAKSQFTLKIAPNGENKEVKVSPETVKAFKSLPGLGQAKAMFSEESLVNLVKQASHAFPDEPVNKGDSWTAKTESPIPQLGKMVADVTLTYAGPEQVDGKTLERIDVEMKMKLTPKDEGAAPKITLKDQKSGGTLHFDNAAGRLSHSKIVQNMVMEIAFGEQNIAQEITQTAKVRLTPADN
jgi:hypothetical protein